MVSAAHILAAGLTPAAVFGIAIFVMWVFSAVMNTKKKPDELKKPSREAQDLAEARRRIREQQNAQKPAITPRAEQQRAKNQQKQLKKQKVQQQRTQQQRPPPLPARTPISAQSTPMLLTSIVPTMPTRADARQPIASTLAIGVAPTAHRQTSETAKNIRLMLQKSGIKEAFILGEVLGKPVSMRDG
jgi:hypothetical protein